MRLSVWPDPTRPFSEVAAIARWAEAHGWDGVYFADHFMPNTPDGTPSSGATLECCATLGALVGLTDRVRLAPLVLGNLYRHPAVVANWAATMSSISHGRFALGLGAGWQINEHAAFGIDLGSVKERLDRFAEATAILRSMLTNDLTSVEGHYFEVHAPRAAGVEVTVPIIIGGKGEQRTMRIAAAFADEWNAWCTPELFAHKSAVLDRHCEHIERDPLAVRRSTQALWYFEDMVVDPVLEASLSGRPRIEGSADRMAEQVAQYRSVGVDELIVPDWNLGGLDPTLERLERCAAIVAESA
jgi:alkanesulfonate monooxygenase SsuD/methylene tetrahydromethanopterin reductase-like flavin-dependent oxidoreductase (luciferase family)